MERNGCLKKKYKMNPKNQKVSIILKPSGYLKNINQRNSAYSAGNPRSRLFPLVTLGFPNPCLLLVFLLIYCFRYYR